MGENVTQDSQIYWKKNVIKRILKCAQKIVFSISHSQRITVNETTDQLWIILQMFAFSLL